jgi:hypothetical protein
MRTKLDRHSCAIEMTEGSEYEFPVGFAGSDRLNNMKVSQYAVITLNIGFNMNLNSEASPHTLSSHFALSHLTVFHFTLKMISPLELACWNSHDPKNVFC